MEKACFSRNIVLKKPSGTTVTLSLRSTALDVVIIPSCVTRCTWGSLGLGLHACWPATPVRHNCNDGGLAVLTTFSSCGTRHGCDDRKCVNETAGRVLIEVLWTADCVTVSCLLAVSTLCWDSNDSDSSAPLLLTSGTVSSRSRQRKLTSSSSSGSIVVRADPQSHA